MKWGTNSLSRNVANVKGDMAETQKLASENYPGLSRKR
jgi:hypothetical protein